MANEIQESIQRAVSTMINHSVNALSLDKTVIGIIDSVVNSTLGIYKVKYDGGYINAIAQQQNAFFPKGMSVYVQIPQNDMTKDKLIIGRANTIRDSLKADVVISAINNFAIVGANMIKSVDDINISGLGLRSYHSAIEEDSNSDNYVENSYLHRYKLVYDRNLENNQYYNFDLDALDIYKKEATGLMIEADFRTSLDEIQKYKSDGNYGLGINLVLKNNNYSNFGETQGAIFDYFAKTIESETTIIVQENEEEPPKYISKIMKVEDWDEKIQELLSSSESSLENIQGEDKPLDIYASYIQTLIENYRLESSSSYLPQEEEIMDSYLTLLSDLNYAEVDSVSKLQEIYNDWRDTKIESKDKIVSYYINCNNMTGNPFSFTSWSSQYIMLDIDMSTFEGVDSIVFFKEGFKEDSSKCAEREEDIFVRNLKVYAIKPLSAVNGDYRLEIQAKDGLIFKSIKEEEVLEIRGKVTKSYYEDLNSHATYFWFKKNHAVTTASHGKYNQYGGIGWEYLGIEKGNTYSFKTNGAENKLYDNHYKCTAVIDGVIVLTQEFHLYNESVSGSIKINSDLGVQFAFDAGVPTLTCLVNDKEQLVVFKDDGTISSDYKYYWAIVVNGQRTFLEPRLLINSSIIPANNIVNTMSLQNILNGVEFYAGDTKISYDSVENLSLINYATRIKYPVTNIIFESGATFECYVEKKDNINNQYYEIGQGELTILNQGAAGATDCYIVIENGDQIFQYDEYGNPPNAQKLKSPQEIKPLSCHFYKPNGIEINSGNYTVKWIMPIKDTLITTNATLVANPAQGNVLNINTNSQCEFGIADLYNENTLNNQISCVVTLGDQTYIKDTNFFFGKVGNNGTNGTDMVMKIEPVANKPIFNTQPLTLYRSNFQNGYAGRLTLNDGTFSVASGEGEDRTKPSLSLCGNLSGLKAVLYQKNDIVNYDENRLLWNVAGSTQTRSNSQGKKIKVEGRSLLWDEGYNEDTNTKKYKDNYIIKAHITHENKSYYAFYALPIIDYKNILPGQSRITIDKTYMLKEVVYNNDGRNPIYNHNQGVKINNLKEGDYVKWSILNDNSDFTLLASRNDTVGQKEVFPPIKRSLKTEKSIPLYVKTKDTEFKENKDYYIFISEDKYVLVNKNQGYDLEQVYYEKKDEYVIILDGWVFDPNKTYYEKDRTGNFVEVNQQTTERDINKTYYIKTFSYEETKDTNFKEDKNYYTLIAGNSYVLVDKNQPFDANAIYYELRRYEEYIETSDTSFKKDKVYYESVGKYQEVTEFRSNKIYYEKEENGEYIETLDLEYSNEKTYYELIYEYVQTTDEDYNVDTIYYEYVEPEDLILDKVMDMVYILPNDEYSGAKCNNIVVGKVYDKEGRLKATVYVPIYMSLNTFGLASLNAWDGNSVTIDEDEGYIMAPQVGAGKKEDNNTFTGVVMGVAEDYSAGENEHITGLFGYKQGLRSFFLDAESGNAYFGTPNLKSDGKNTEKVKVWDRDSNTWKEYEDYNEGQIELIPGGESKIGGWRLGRQSLYYTSSGKIGNKYGTGVRVTSKDINSKQLDYIPQKDGSISEDTSTPKRYSGHHVKDIKEEDSGILIHAGNSPYISIKGRKLEPGGIDEGLLDTGTESFLSEGDSLEIQLDPQTPTLFSIFRHNGQARYREVEGEPEPKLLYAKDSRTFLAGINGRGQLVANGLQSMTQNTNQGSPTDTVTTFGIDAVAAFGESMGGKIAPSYIGLKMLAGSDMVGKLFVKDPKRWKIGSEDGSTSADESTLYLTGSGVIDNEYKRPVSIHGKTISLYANPSATGNNNLIKKTTDNYIQISDGAAFIGRDKYSRLSLSNSNSELYTANINNISATALNLIARSNNLILVGKNGDNENAKIILDPDASNGGITINAARGITATANSADLILERYSAGSFKGKVTIGSVSTKISRADVPGYDSDVHRVKTPQLMINDNADENSYFDALAKMYLRANQNIYIQGAGSTIELDIGGKKAKVNDKAATPTSELVLNTGADWGARTIDNPAVTLFKVYNSQLGGVLYQTRIKPGSPESSSNFWQGTTASGFTSGLSGYSATSNGMIDGLRFNWGYFPGYMYDSNYSSYVSSSDSDKYGETSIYAGHRIVAGGTIRSFKDVWANGDVWANSVSLKKHTHPFSKPVTVNLNFNSGGENSIILYNKEVGTNAILNVNAGYILNQASYSSDWTTNVTLYVPRNINIDASFDKESERVVFKNITWGYSRYTNPITLGENTNIENIICVRLNGTAEGYADISVNCKKPKIELEKATVTTTDMSKVVKVTGTTGKPYQ